MLRFVSFNAVKIWEPVHFQQIYNKKIPWVKFQSFIGSYNKLKKNMIPNNKLFHEI